MIKAELLRFNILRVDNRFLFPANFYLRNTYVTSNKHSRGILRTYDWTFIL